MLAMPLNTTNSLRNEAQKPESCCQFPGCTADGEFPGPTREIPASMQRAGWEGDAGQSHQRPMYCLNHIRLINNGWNFFDGMNAEEIHAFERDALTGHRPVKQTNMRLGNSHFETVERGYEQAFKMRFGDDVVFEASPPPPTIPNDIAEALELLSLTYPCTKQMLKTAYRKLAKQHHPDHQTPENRKHAEETLKSINHAYHVLKQSEWID